MNAGLSSGLARVRRISTRPSIANPLRGFFLGFAKIQHTQSKCLQMKNFVKRVLGFWRRSACSSLSLSILSISVVACGPPAGRLEMDRGDGLGAESFAISPKNPACPVAAVKRKLDGLVVIVIDVNDKGKIETANVLGSPDKTLRDAALRNALSTSFSMPRTGETQNTSFGSGRLFFYFHCSSFPYKALMPSDFVQKHS
jgi:hypothetical protein